ncbi:hypothetical protein FIE12Z_10269 [Fusarium flagelliforme]|uniref:Zn(2)-C6 fungal-type domain-containing protein n=1 Tax=Fusarium flagelliforme TaxID=2675880 RepID=A0A395MCE9_9HYPO|nr:hypothetical protein FIE12Z_10269 [Fusarium flagelliforme]
MSHFMEARDDSDADSSIGDDVASSTTSVSSSILEYRKFHGRTYHSDKYDSEYFAPNDERQRDSMDITHHSLTLLLDGKLTLAPIKEGPMKVLDVGTGSGIWAIDFADAYPSSTVTGTDLSPIQPTFIPPNVQFHIEDATSPWTFPPSHFDFVHIRYLIGAISDWGALFKEAFRCCTPGGYIESAEINPLFVSDDGSIDNVEAFQTWNKICRECEGAFGRSLCEIGDDVGLLKKAGFEELQVTDFKMPVGGWAKDENLRRVGQYLRAAIENDLEVISAYILPLIIDPSTLTSQLITMARAAGRPSTSCNICKIQKIRCSGDKPSCTRCARLKASCRYNSGGIQKALRQVDRPISSRKSTPSSRFSSTPTAAGPRYSQSDVPQDDIYHEIPPSLFNTLVHLYFRNVYQSTLLFHKPTFLQSLSNGTVRQHVILSICAWGANFYRDENGNAPLKDQGLMTEWAKKAGSLVFQDAEDLNDDNIVTHCNISLFWHNQGSWRIRNACQLLHIIGTGSSTASLKSEIRRRRFWACYLMHCFSSEKLFRFEAIADVESLPLPWPENSFEAGLPPDEVATIGNGVDTGSIFAELIRGLHLWCSVVSVVRSKDTDLSTRIQQIFKTESEISVWWQRVPDNFKLNTSTILTTDQSSLPKILLTNLVYHQSLCALHSSIVPLFCWSKGDRACSTARHLSAQIAYEHASTISSLIRSVLGSGFHVSSMPIFVAYAAYSSCAIQIPFLWCSQLEVKVQAQLNVETNINMIREMASYWKLASLLQVYARCIHEVHKRNPPTISNEPKYAGISPFVDFGAETNLAKASILEFTGILRSDNGGYVKPGEESRDLTAKTTEDDGTMTDSSRDVQPFIFSEVDYTQQSSLPETVGSEWPTFDVCNSLLDADITTLLPMDDTLDLSAFDFNFLTADNSNNI